MSGTISSYSSPHGPTAQHAEVRSLSPHYPFSPPSWQHHTLDPSLFSTSSELANALTLPPSSRISHVPPPPESQQPTEPQPAVHSPQNDRQLSSETPQPQPVASTSNTALPIAENGLPPRYCSIKGCKALVSANSFFKMCEPCRNRYRSYGTTKRAKWKREKEVAVAELERVRSEEEMRRAEEGLPPLQDREPEWRSYTVDEQDDEPSRAPSVSAAAVHGPRMCTVSHCREILPAGYAYLRCERHRIQNRHHSKLKRVRDKEVKAQAYDGWAAALSARATSTQSDDASGEEDSIFPDAEFDVGGSSSALFDGLDAGAQEYPLDLPFGEPTEGIPPAARGMRRTNHVCSVKACFNLLSPNNPWKMCDACRARDRAIRRYKALRDSGIEVELPPGIREAKNRRPRGEGKVKRKSRANKRRSRDTDQTADDDAEDEEATSDEVSGTGPLHEATRTTGEGSSVQMAMPTQVVFMEPLLPDAAGEPQSSVSDTNQPGQYTGMEPLQTTFSVSDVTVVSSVSAPPAPAKKKTKRKEKTTEASSGHGVDSSQIAGPSTMAEDSANAEQAMQAGPSTSEASTNMAVDANVQAGVPPGYMPPYPMPYYMPPYGVPGYPPAPMMGNQSSTFPYPQPMYPYARPAYGAPPPMYQAPYAPYPPPYPFPPQPYTQPYAPQAYAAPPPPVPATSASVPPADSPVPSTSPLSPDAAVTSASPPATPMSIPVPAPPPVSVPAPTPVPDPTPAQPPPPPEPAYYVSSDFVTRAEYASQNSPPPADGVAPPASYFFTAFNSRTGETINRTQTERGFRKRLLSEAEVAAYKRRLQELSEKERIANSVFPAVTPTGLTPPPAPATAPGAPPAHQDAPSASTSTTAQHAPGPSVNPADNRQQDAQSTTCGNKSCHRALPADQSGGLCTRCKERFKKKQAVAKHRYKLEPRTLLSRPGAAPEQS